MRLTIIDILMSAQWILACFLIHVSTANPLNKNPPSPSWKLYESNDRTMNQPYLIAYNEENGENVVIDENIFKHMKEELLKKLFSSTKTSRKINVNTGIRGAFGRNYKPDEDNMKFLSGYTTTERQLVPFERYLIIANPVESYAQKHLTSDKLKNLIFTKRPNENVTLLPDYPEDIRKKRAKKLRMIKKRAEILINKAIQERKDKYVGKKGITNVPPSDHRIESSGEDTTGDDTNETDDGSDTTDTNLITTSGDSSPAEPAEITNVPPSDDAGTDTTDTENLMTTSGDY